MSNSGTATATTTTSSCSNCGKTTEGSSPLCDNCVANGAVKSTVPPAEIPLGLPVTQQTELTPKPKLLASLKKHEKSIKHWSHSCSNFAQVIALVLVGIWTIKTFSHSEAPGLEPHLRADMEIAWKGMAKPSLCQAKLTVKIENNSKQIIKVTAMHIDGWMASVPTNALPHFSPDKEVRSGTYFFHEDFPDNYMVGPLMPGAVAYDSFAFEFENEPMKRVMWLATFKTDPPLGYDPQASESDLICNYK